MGLSLIPDASNCINPTYINTLKDAMNSELANDVYCVPCGTAESTFTSLIQAQYGVTPTCGIVIEQCAGAPVAWGLDSNGDWYNLAGVSPAFAVGQSSDFADCNNPTALELTNLFPAGIQAEAHVYVACSGRSYYTESSGLGWVEFIDTASSMEVYFAGSDTAFTNSSTVYQNVYNVGVSGLPFTPDLFIVHIDGQIHATNATHQSQGNVYLSAGSGTVSTYDWIAGSGTPDRMSGNTWAITGLSGSSWTITFRHRTSNGANTSTIYRSRITVYAIKEAA